LYILDNCSRFVENIQNCNNQKLIDYLKYKFDNLLKKNNIKEIIYSALPYGAEEEHINKILEIITEVSLL
jgi:hypothetical protein